MKKFETPVLEIEKVEITDVITTSGCPEYNPCGTELPAIE